VSYSDSSGNEIGLEVSEGVSLKKDLQPFGRVRFEFNKKKGSAKALSDKKILDFITYDKKSLFKSCQG
jgi:hypothetical protein